MPWGGARCATSRLLPDCFHSDLIHVLYAPNVCRKSLVSSSVPRCLGIWVSGFPAPEKRRKTISSLCHVSRTRRVEEAKPTVKFHGWIPAPQVLADYKKPYKERGIWSRSVFKLCLVFIRTWTPFTNVRFSLFHIHPIITSIRGDRVHPLDLRHSRPCLASHIHFHLLVPLSCL